MRLYGFRLLFARAFLLALALVCAMGIVRSGQLLRAGGPAHTGVFTASQESRCEAVRDSHAQYAPEDIADHACYTPGKYRAPVDSRSRDAVLVTPDVVRRGTTVTSGILGDRTHGATIVMTWDRVRAERDRVMHLTMWILPLTLLVCVLLRDAFRSHRELEPSGSDVAQAKRDLALRAARKQRYYEARTQPASREDDSALAGFSAYLRGIRRDRRR